MKHRHLCELNVWRGKSDQNLAIQRTMKIM